MFQPINRLHLDPDRFDGYDIRPVAALAAKVRAFYDSIQPPDSDPMLEFEDRDLVRHVGNAESPEIHLDLRVDVEPRPWEQFLRTSGNPLVPPVGQVIGEVLDPAEAELFTSYLRPLSSREPDCTGEHAPT